MIKVLTPLILILSGCSSFHYLAKKPCYNRPEMVQVNVVKGTIQGKDLDSVIENHQRLWQYIHLLEKKSCK